MVAPLFFLLVFGTIDFGGYFGSRLSVEEAARAGARVADVQCNQTGCTYSGSAIVNAIVAQKGMVKLPTTVNCTWAGNSLAPSVYPPFTFSGNGCIGIWYFNLYAATTGPPVLCGPVERGQLGAGSGTRTAAAPRPRSPRRASCPTRTSWWWGWATVQPADAAADDRLQCPDHVRRDPAARGRQPLTPQPATAGDVRAAGAEFRLPEEGDRVS